MSLKTLKKLHKVTYDRAEWNGVFKVHTLGRIVNFQPHKKWLHYMDLKEEENSGITLVTAVRENYQGFSKDEIEKKNASNSSSNLSWLWAYGVC